MLNVAVNTLVSVIMTAQNNQRRRGRKRIQECCIDPWANDNVRTFGLDAEIPEEAGPVRTFPGSEYIPQMREITWYEIQCFQPTVPSDMHQADNSNTSVTNYFNQIVYRP